MYGILAIFVGLASFAETEISLTDLTRHPGLMAFKERESKIIQSYHLHLHIVQLERFQSCLDAMRYTSRSLDQNNSTKEFQEILNLRMQRILESFYRLKPFKRHRRGLFNPLGTVIKSITGNLDNNDIEDIQKILSETQEKTNNLISNNERQISINTELQNKINSVIEHVNVQQIQVLKEIMNLRNQINQQASLIFRQVFHKLLFNLDVLEKQLNDIFESVQMSRVGILPKAILSENETNFILEILENQDVDIITIDQIYEYLEVHTLHNKSSIIFVTKIPIFLPGKFRYVLIENIPKNGKIVVLNFKIAISGKNAIFGSKIDCQITEQYRICRRKDLTDLSDDRCIANALQGSEAACNFKESRNITEITQVDTHTIIIKNAVHPITVNSNTCDLGIRQITGTIMITFEKCSITVNNSHYNSEPTIDHHELSLIPMIGIKVQESTFTKEYDLQQLNTLHIINRNNVVQLQNHQRTFQHVSIGSFILLLSTLIILAVWFKQMSKRNKIYTENQPSASPGQENLTYNN